jgi:hypothetical protein
MAVDDPDQRPGHGLNAQPWEGFTESCRDVISSGARDSTRAAPIIAAIEHQVGALGPFKRGVGAVRADQQVSGAPNVDFCSAPIALLIRLQGCASG